MKKKLLIAYYTMMMGGSTTSLIAFLNCLDKDVYDIDLQLYRNEGELLDFIPEGVNLLPPAAKYGKIMGKPMQILKGIFSGTFVKARRENRKIGRQGFAQQVLSAFQANSLSKKNPKHYDYAIGFIEGWSDIYVANQVNADKKYAWIHSTYQNVAPIAHLEFPWMEKVDKIVFVSDACLDDFRKIAPEFAEKSIALENILDSDVIRRRSCVYDQNDADYGEFAFFDGFKIMTVCRIDISIKGLDRALACAKDLKERGLSFRWCIIGGGEQLATLKDEVGRLGLNDCVRCVGEKLNPYPYIKEADVYCMLSRYEGKPMTITESKILAVPPIVTAYLSAKDQVAHGTEGFVVENSDGAPAQAAEIIFELAASADKLNELKDHLANHDYGNSSYIRAVEELLFKGDPTPEAQTLRKD